METNYSETFIDIIVSVNERKATLDFRSYLLHTANIPCLICLPEIRIFGANFLLDKLIQVYYKVILSIHLIFFYQAESNDLIARRDD